MPADELSPAVEAFSEYLARVEDGAEVDFDAFCAHHREFEPELRRMHDKWASMTSAFEELASHAPHGDHELDSATTAFLDRIGTPQPRNARYSRAKEIARGGMGTIQQVWDEDLRRTLAMKVLTDAQADGRQVSRFLAEAQLTGQLDHPGVIPVHEIGLDAKGRLFYTMPLVRGQEFKEIINRVHRGDEEWSLERALGVLVRVAETMAYAHSLGVLHRDLKPTNLMVAPFGEVYVMDWGLARLQSDPKDSAAPAGHIDTQRREVNSNDASPMVTADGDVLGTPAYMPPEQAQGELQQLDARADIYALGAILYHLLVGRIPYVGPSEQPTSQDLLAQILAGPPPALRTVAPNLSPELVAICERAMCHSREGRFPAMIDLVENLRAYLEGRVVRSYEQGHRAELRKWLQRNRTLAGSIAAGLLILIAGLIISTTLYFAADRHAKRADGNAAHLRRELSASRVQRGRLLGATENSSAAASLIWREHLEGDNPRQTRWALWELAAARPILASRKISDGINYGVRSVPGGGGYLTGGLDGPKEAPLKRGILRLWNQHGSEPRVIGTHGMGIRALAVSPDGKLAATGGFDRRVVLWDLAAGRQLWVSSVHHGRVLCLAFSPDGQQLYTGGRDRRLYVHRVNDGTSTRLRTYPAAVTGLQMNSPGTLLAVGCFDGRIHVGPPGAPPRSVLQGHKKPVEALLFHASRGQLISGSWDRTIRTWNLDTGASVSVFRTQNGPTRDLILATDGSTLYASGRWRIESWDLATGTRTRRFSLQSPGWGLALDAEEKVLVSGHSNGEIRSWDLADGRAAHRLEHHTGTVSVAITGAGHVAATGDHAGVVRLWETTTGTLLRSMQAHRDRVRALAFSPDGSVLASAGLDDTLHLWDAETGQLQRSFEGLEANSNTAVVFHPTGKTFAWSRGRGQVRLTETNTGATKAQFRCESGEVLSLTYDQLGKRLATTERRNQVEIWSSDGRHLTRIPLAGPPWSVCFLSSNRLAVGSWDKSIQIFDLNTKKRLHLLTGHNGVVWSLARGAHPDLLISSSDDRTVRLWDLRAGRNLAVLPQRSGAASTIGVSRDGRTLVGGSSAGHAILFDLDYFDRHVAGQMGHQIQREHAIPLAADRVQALLDWKRTVDEAPWPRFKSP